MARTSKCKVLMVFPRFNPKSFWSFEGVLHVVGARYPAAPLGLITVAAMLPADWDVRLINRNTEELMDGDLAWADMVMTGGMCAQQLDTHAVIKICRTHNIPVVVGGPDVMSSPHLYADADFRVVGEAEDALPAFIAAWKRGERQGCFEVPKFQADVRQTPIPRFDLLKFDHYLYIGVQFSRGCPFTCEFCDIIELYGRRPRTKSPKQMLAELDALYALGYRGHVDFVDDNLIGNQKAVKEFLPHLIAWQKAHNYPFMLSTEASINLSDVPQLLQLLREANFFAIFVGIESPDADTLVHMSKKQNTRRSIAESVRRINAFGIFVIGGFIVGFNSERGRIASADNSMHRGLRTSGGNGWTPESLRQYGADASLRAGRAAVPWGGGGFRIGYQVDCASTGLILRLRGRAPTYYVIIWKFSRPFTMRTRFSIVCVEP